MRDDPAVEAERAAAVSRPANDPIREAAAYVKARIAIENPAGSVATAREAVDDFAARARRRNLRLAELIGLLADQRIEAKNERRQLYLRILTEFPNSREAQTAKLRIEQLDEERFLAVIDPAEAAADPHIGQIFQFAFADAVSGEFISSNALRGHVVVIDFWATWCPPCMESIPRMKEHYAKYNPQGVAFVGVSHDDTQKDGLQKLLNCVAEHQIPWPQFFQNNRELSRPWGVRGIPAVFVIDQTGRIVTKRANLDVVLPKLLKDDQPSNAPPPKTKSKTPGSRP